MEHGPKGNENIQNKNEVINSLGIKSLKEQLLKSLESKNISENQKETNQEILQELYNINFETSLALSELKNNLETEKLSENISQNISQTRESLSNLGLNLENNYFPKNLMISNDSLGNSFAYNENSTIEKSVITNKENLETSIQVFDSLNQEQKGEIGKKLEKELGNFEKEGFSIKKIKFGTTNDNIPPVGSPEIGDDQGNSFGFFTEVLLEKKGQLYLVKGDMSAYTDGTGINIKGKKKYMEHGKNFLDVSNLQILKGVYNQENDRGDSFDVFLGGGLQMRGVAPKFMKNIQNKWHETFNMYENTSKYTGEKGFSPTVGAQLEGKKYFLGDKNFGTYVGTKLEGNFAIDKKGISNATAEGFVGANYKKLDIQAGIGKSVTFGGKNSEVLNFANGQNNYGYGKINIPLGKNLSAYSELRIDLSSKKNIKNGKNERSSGAFGIEYKF